ncbi:hypothetical protein BU024_10240 [Staphylococcus simulans]|nr:hypothetical protein BU024_10240 [Staphylococcus simulans]
MLILAQVATFLLALLFVVSVSHVFIKVLIERSSYTSKQILKLIFIIALSGTLILWMLYLVFI